MDETLARILPQRPPMVMIDELTASGPDWAEAKKTFHEGDYGVAKGEVLEPSLLEGLAQTVAAWKGKQTLETGRPLRRGMLVGVQDFSFILPAKLGLCVDLRVRLLERFGPFSLVEGEATQEGRTLARGTLKFFEEE